MSARPHSLPIRQSSPQHPGSWPLLILMAKSEIPAIHVWQADENLVCQRAGRRENDFAISITFGEMGWFGGLARFSWPQGSAENRTFLRGSLSVILIEVPILSTSPKAAKSRPLLHRWGMTLT
jgi:hypothetical protein